jgi:hypothetical protein
MLKGTSQDFPKRHKNPSIRDTCKPSRTSQDSRGAHANEAPSVACVSYPTGELFFTVINITS